MEAIIVDNIRERQYVWMVESSGEIRLWQSHFLGMPLVDPHKWLMQPAIVESYPGLVLMADDVHKGSDLTVISAAGHRVMGRALMLGVSASGHLTALTKAEVERLALVAQAGRVLPRYLQVLPCAEKA